ncbi:hypothetical protein OSCI_1010022 [Kamptonema sp. PCC 6506]|nr:hypothetical protein OSCI_1010022 [Kamptonema sp. PCC 6506]
MSVVGVILCSPASNPKRLKFVTVTLDTMEGGLENNNDLNNTKSQGENYFNPSDEKNEPLATSH